MPNQPRVAKVLITLVTSMTFGAIVLLALGNNAPSAGAFCLSSYYDLNPVNNAVLSQAPQNPQRWTRIEIYFSGTAAGNVEQIAALNGLPSAEDINCHFVVTNGRGGNDGEIIATEKWQRQWSCIPGSTWHGHGQTVRICVIGENDGTPTDFQMRRIDALVETIYRRFTISPDSVYYPSNW